MLLLLLLRERARAEEGEGGRRAPPRDTEGEDVEADLIKPPQRARRIVLFSGSTASHIDGGEPLGEG